MSEPENPPRSLLAADLFPGRRRLYISDAAHALGCLPNDVMKLITTAQLDVEDVVNGPCVMGETKLDAKRLRIPVAAWDAYIGRIKAQ